MTYSVCHAPLELLVIHIMEKCNFLKSLIHSQIIKFSVINGLTCDPIP